MAQWTNLQWIEKFENPVHTLGKIWWPVPSGTRSYGRLAGRLAEFGQG